MNSPNDQIYIYPTDTVWGIGCSIYSEAGYQKIAEIKNTSTDKPLSILFSSVDEVVKSFNFPAGITELWLSEFFKSETTLGILAKCSKILIPPWVTQGSEYVSLRCLENDVVKKIYAEIGTPFFTTSLNITGEPPIITTLEAEAFQKNFAPTARVFKATDGVVNQKLSGSSSTIIFLNANNQFEIKREGKRVEEVKHLLKNIKKS